VQIEQAGHKRHPFGLNDTGTRAQLDFRRDGLNAVAADDDGLLRRLGAGPVNHGRPDDGDYIFVVLFAGVGDTVPGVPAPGTMPMFVGVGGEKKHADEYHDRQQSAFHQVSRIANFGQLRKSRTGYYFYAKNGA
jgi:hypothetical protein